MTAEQKTTLARFLDITGDFLKDGHARNREAYVFADDEMPPPNAKAQTQTAAENTFSSLPLAYQVDEFEASEPAAETQTLTQAPLEEKTLQEIAADIAACRACALAATRTHAVPGEGAPKPLVLVIGEGPGADEDASGRPFVGRAGQLLDKMLASIGLSREENCYIANVVKCRPPGNRDPKPEETAACFPFLQQQIKTLRPRVILCAGRVAAQNLLKTGKGINALRLTFAEFNNQEEGEDGEVIPVLCTFHPSALLRDESLKRPAWEDLKLLRAHIDSASGGGE